MNDLIRSYPKKSPAKKAKMEKLFKHRSMKRAKERCEAKYGLCSRANAFAYCYKCKRGYSSYWKTDTNSCGCKRDTKVKVLTHKQQRSRFLWLEKMIKKFKKSDDARSENAEKTILAEAIDNEQVSDVFFFQIED